MKITRQLTHFSIGECAGNRYAVPVIRTVVVGENSSGKSALLSMLNPSFQDQPFRSEASAEGSDLAAGALCAGNGQRPYRSAAR